MNLTRSRAAAISALLVLISAPSALAHHSTALFDLSQTVTLTGKVVKFDWINPHVILYLEVGGQQGEKPKTWAIELASPGNLTRNGWDKRTFKPGDAINVDIGPMRDGQPGGFFKKATLANGQPLTFKLQP